MTLFIILCKYKLNSVYIPRRVKVLENEQKNNHR